MKYALLKYDENKVFFNIGDNIQSLAAKQFLPQVDTFVNREHLADYKGDKMKVIMNGWFTHNYNNWLPSEDIEPLFISFHVNNTAAPYMLTENAVAYLKAHEPIGCRDEFTVETLKAKGINAYFSGCLTLTLDSYKVDDTLRGDDIYIVDPLYSYPTWEKVTYDWKRVIRSIQNGDFFKTGKQQQHLRKFIDEELLKTAKFINQEPPANTYTDAQKFAMAEDLLHKYAKAKLVITSRIHCALPCLALGTPVIFVNGFDSFVDSCRFEGILELFNRIDIDTNTGNFTANFPLAHKIDINTKVQNLGKHHAIAEPMKKTCKDFIAKQ